MIERDGKLELAAVALAMNARQPGRSVERPVCAH